MTPDGPKYPFAAPADPTLSLVPQPARHNIVVLGGGGIRGILGNQVLIDIEAQTGRRIQDSFQFICGTSTGAIQAAALAKDNPLSAVDLEMAYEGLAERVFKSRWWAAGGLFAPKYSAAALEAELKHILGNVALHTATGFGAVTYDMLHTEPVLVTSFGSYASELHALWAIARASSAAPTYFPPFDDRWIDGGLSANLPCAWAALDYAEHFRVPLSEITVLAIGTGVTSSSMLGAFKGGVGQIPDAIRVGMDSNQDMEAIYCRYLGLKAFTHLQIPLPPNCEAMDDVSEMNIHRLVRLGQKMLAVNRAKLDAHLRLLAPAETRVA